MSDSASGKPLVNALAQMPKPRYYAEQRRAQSGKRVNLLGEGPDDVYWYALTDSAGYGRLSGFRPGDHTMQVDVFCYRNVERVIHAVAGRVDTMRVEMVYVGRPPDGRSEEVRFVLDTLALKKARRRHRP